MPNWLQVSNRMPSILQSLNRMFWKTVLLQVTRLRLQPLKLQSVNLNLERSCPLKSQWWKVQSSYSPGTGRGTLSKVCPQI